MSVVHYPPRSTPSNLQPGDFILCRASDTRGRNGATTLLGRLIQAGERARFGDSDFARWTHSALVVDSDGSLVEAIESGVHRDDISKYRNTDFMLVTPESPSALQRTLACEFAEAHIGDSYGILNFVALAVQSLFGLNISLHMDQQFICSGLVSRATEKYISTYPRSPEDMMPADLAKFWGAESGEPLPKLGFFGRVLDLVRTVLNR